MSFLKCHSPLYNFHKLLPHKTVFSSCHTWLSRNLSSGLISYLIHVNYSALWSPCFFSSAIWLLAVLVGAAPGSDVFRIHLRDSWRWRRLRSHWQLTDADGDKKEPLANSAGTKQLAPRPSLAAVEGNSRSLLSSKLRSASHKHGLLLSGGFNSVPLH